VIVDSRATKTVVTEATVTLTAEELRFLTGVLKRYAAAQYTYRASEYSQRTPSRKRRAAAMAETFEALS
jgi:hypothetical protein